MLGATGLFFFADGEYKCGATARLCTVTQTVLFQTCFARKCTVESNAENFCCGNGKGKSRTKDEFLVLQFLLNQNCND